MSSSASAASGQVRLQLYSGYHQRSDSLQSYLRSCRDNVLDGSTQIVGAVTKLQIPRRWMDGRYTRSMKAHVVVVHPDPDEDLWEAAHHQIARPSMMMKCVNSNSQEQSWLPLDHCTTRRAGRIPVTGSPVSPAHHRYSRGERKAPDTMMLVVKHLQPASKKLSASLPFPACLLVSIQCRRLISENSPLWCVTFPHLR